jgi:ribonuclease HII
MIYEDHHSSSCNSCSSSHGQFSLFKETNQVTTPQLIAGVDEAGRGPLAGPVVAAGVILPDQCELDGIKDSKQLKEKERECLFSLICHRAISIGVGVISSQYIDRYNILKATLEAMKRAVLSMTPAPEILLVDGINRIPLNIPQRCIKQGDRKIQSISAASIVAKVYRDRIMRALHRDYPVYGFIRNKGYGTKEHLSALKRYGPCPIHRFTFRGVAELT